MLFLLFCGGGGLEVSTGLLVTPTTESIGFNCCSTDMGVALVIEGFLTRSEGTGGAGEVGLGGYWMFSSEGGDGAGFGGGGGAG